MLQKFFEFFDNEEVIDPDTGETYNRMTGNIQGVNFEVHEDLTNKVDRYHARANGDPKTAKANMDDGGLVGWFLKILGG